MAPYRSTARFLIDSRDGFWIILAEQLKGDFHIKKTLGITLALVVGGGLVLITLVLVLQVILSLLGAE